MVKVENNLKGTIEMKKRAKFEWLNMAFSIALQIQIP